MSTVDAAELQLRRGGRRPAETIQLAFVLVAVLVPMCVSRLLLWPLALAPVVGLYLALAFRNPELRVAPAWLRRGRLDRRTLLVTAFVTFTSCAVLLGWYQVAHPDLSSHLARIPDRAPALLLMTGAIFALLNATVEEVVFRGLLQTLAEERYGPKIALMTQAVFFGLGHYAGVPSGWTGVVMAAAYGLALGMLRRWCGGLGAPILSHIALDATIFCLVVSTL